MIQNRLPRPGPSAGLWASQFSFRRLWAGRPRDWLLPSPAPPKRAHHSTLCGPRSPWQSPLMPPARGDLCLQPLQASVCTTLKARSALCYVRRPISVWNQTILVNSEMCCNAHNGLVSFQCLLNESWKFLLNKELCHQGHCFWPWWNYCSQLWPLTVNN